MEDILLQHFRQLISARTGLHIRKQDSETFRKKIVSRLKICKLSKPEEYYQLLETDTAESSLEWQELTLLLTTGESYFFRDQGQFALLQSRILPELIERRRAQRSLRIWSAGCSSGEEPYSLAILVDELLPHREDWNILILGSDINNEAIGKAKRGVYSPWSFRTVKSDLQMRYFRKRRNDWELDERIRKMVTFRSGNLLKDQFPSYTLNLHSLDLILCRNVFIYFAPEAVSAVIGKFADTLNQGGYLMTGHAELYGQNLGRLRARVFPESVIYQRDEHTLLETPAEVLETSAANIPVVLQGSVPLPPHPGPLPNGERGLETFNHRGEGSVSPLTARNATKETTPTPSPSLLTEAEICFRSGAYSAAIEKAALVIKNNPHHFGALYLMAQAHANLGKYDQATRCCRQALEVDSFAVNPYYLLAHLAEEQGDIEEAKSLLKKIIYLSPSFVAAYLDLGALYERENDAVRARKMRVTALELLKAMPSQTTIEPYGELTAGELVHYVQKMVKGASGDS